MITNTEPDTPDAESPAYYFAGVEDWGDGERVPVAIYSSTADFEKHIGASSETLERCEFVPLATRRRFRIVEESWFPDFPDDDDRAFKKRSAKRDIAIEAFLPPSSLVDVPAVHVWNEHQGRLCGYGRESGLQRVAVFNRKSIMKHARKTDDRIGMEWAMLVELGQPLPALFHSFWIGNSGVGKLESTKTYTARIVRPTAAERAQYAITPAQ